MTAAPPGRGAPSRLAVVLCTRNRPDGALAVVRSILRDNARTRVVVVDQSDDDATASRVPALAGRGDVRVIRDARRGLAAARNLGVRAVEADIIAFTDDDCDVGPGWAAGLEAAFRPDERIGMVFGVVRAAEYDRSRGFIPSYAVPKPLVADRLGHKGRIEGMGACMAVRRTAWDRLGGFDELLGSGARFRAGEDADFAMRLLWVGWRVVETPDVAVHHHGFRTWAQGKLLIDGYMYGLGATQMKMLRLAGWRSSRPLAELGWRWLAGSPVIDLNHRPPRLRRLTTFLRGARDGFHTPLDRGTGRFVLREA